MQSADDMSSGEEVQLKGEACSGAGSLSRKGAPWSVEEHCAFLKGLEKLGKGSCLDDSCLASLAPLGRSLTRLSLTAFTTSLASQEAAQGLAALPHLTSLELQSAAALTDTGLAVLCHSPCAPQLCHLALQHTSAGLVTEHGLQLLAATCTSLTTLNLSYCGSAVSDAVLLQLASSVPRLKELQCSLAGGVTDAGLVALLRCPQLDLLDLSYCQGITGRVTSLTSLRLARCPELTDVGVAALSRLVRLSTLSLAHCNITEVGLLALSPLTALASMEF
ncbi:uncharacterized protein HaLaN_17041 [Haematococcus lacustris]|uniref:Uncharacterized protein n=1 Tax=Haematococcus lacustris TaxID=44745 RepID=A0A699ZM37_HAELA|nr:uncharacterized protein HaLaN_17041 [Haematococcus lacustris]